MQGGSSYYTWLGSHGKDPRRVANNGRGFGDYGTEEGIDVEGVIWGEEGGQLVVVETEETSSSQYSGAFHRRWDRKARGLKEEEEEIKIVVGQVAVEQQPRVGGGVGSLLPSWASGELEQARAGMS
ncbi:hypothetical protein [Oryza sativa Japonica Group]|uniref:Uncharacterized protein n=2 Tax=Oryza sativa subsp. japonica TaxID=39947 RepID=Q5JJQ3_ORYSJ|nr:hypothetical protein [Oryza sativa Japonica Group]BAD88329.1 hypothetical protein [Oryza sativa Japonica Group]